MAKATTWARKIKQIRKALEAFPNPDLTRVDVQKLFEVRRSQADTILSAAGARTVVSGAGMRLKVIARTALLDYLKYGKAGLNADREIDRQTKLAETIEASQADLELRSVPIPAAKRSELRIALDDIRSKLIFDRGRFSIEHRGAADLLHTLWLLSQALGSGYPYFCALVEEADAGAPPRGKDFRLFTALELLEEKVGKLVWKQGGVS